MGYSLTHRRFPKGYSKLLRSYLTVLAGILTLVLIPTLLAIISQAARPDATSKNDAYPLARLDDRKTVLAKGRGSPSVSLDDGHELITSYAGPANLRLALEDNLAVPLSLASADFDEDGVPDLVSGYGFDGHGILTVMRGNVDSIYPNTAEAQQRRANGLFTAAPFLSPAQLFETSSHPDFIAAGDFDCDTHWDIAVATRGGQTVQLLSGDGHGSFVPTRVVPLAGQVTAFLAGDINRRDGLTDLVIALVSQEGSRVLVFEGPGGALLASPEVHPVPDAVTSLAMGQLDYDYAVDLAAASGNELHVVYGRDRKLSLDAAQRATVKQAVRSQHKFDSPIRSIAVGRFSSNEESLAVLDANAAVQLLSPAETFSKATDRSNWSRETIASGMGLTTKLTTARLSTSSYDDLVVTDSSANKLQIINKEGLSDSRPVSLDVIGEPIAILPMRLGPDAFTDLAVLKTGMTTAGIVENRPAATFVVTNTNASGAGSLQFAILDANETPGADLISFNIPGTGKQIINVTAALPAITDPVMVDGTTQPGFAGTPLIEINGDQAGKGANGLVLSANNCTVRALSITGFDFNPNSFDPVTSDGGGAAISMRSNNNIIDGNDLGLTPFIYAGVRAVGPAVNNLIGGTTAAARNEIVAFLAVLLPSGANSNTVQGNLLIGSGSGVGISVQVGGSGGSSNLVGGTVAGARNVIEGARTEDCGIRIGGNANLVQGNYVGTNETGNSTTVPTQGFGVIFTADVADNTVGGTTAAARNLISGNRSAGIRTLSGSFGTNTNLIQGNFIGTNAAGTADLGNLQQGIVLRGGKFTIGGTAAGAGNLIAGNDQHGIEISVNGTYVIQGNLIGTDVTGNLDLGNTQNGVYFFNTPNTSLGGTDAGAGNTISGNGLSGVLIEGPQATGNLVQGNLIGTNSAGTAVIANDLNGVTTSQAPNNTIGGATTSARNIISGNARHGVSIGIDTNSGATGVTVRNNFIGTDVSGTGCLGNQRDGVFVNRGSVSHTITENLITCNGRNGVNIPNFVTNDAGIRIEVVENSIFANSVLGIDLGDAGITANDPGDPDGGANFQQNFPELVSAGPAAISEGRSKLDASVPGPLEPDAVNVNGTLNSSPNTTYTVHWYFSPGSQCATNQAASRPLVTGKVPNVTTNSSGNASFSFPLDFPLGHNSGIVNCTATDSQGNTSEFSACLFVSETGTPTVKFSAASFDANENAGSTSLNVTRSGDSSAPLTVNYATSDLAGSSGCDVLNSAYASSRCDYEFAAGTLRFNPGETVKTINISLIDDAYDDGNEQLTVTLSNVTGGSLGSPGVATVTILDNDSANGPNPIDEAFFFVRLHYIDFLNREPDPSGWNFWAGEITSCGSNAGCIDVKRSNVSAAFYVSIEFQETGFLVYRMYKAAYGNLPGAPVPIRLEEFLPDTQQIGQGVIVNQGDWQAQLEANKVSYANDFVTRNRFTSAYATSLTPAQFVDALFANAGVTPTAGERTSIIGEFGGAGNTTDQGARARAVRRVAENAVLVQQEYNRAFVLMQYFGYLRRNPYDPPEPTLDYGGFNFWLGKLNDFGGNYIQAEMVRAFITSIEYRKRFGP